MIVPKETYDCVTSYMLGMEKVLENSYLHLFTNWLIHKYNAPSEFDFYGQVKFLYNKRNKNKIISDEQNLIKFLFDLFYDFMDDNELLFKNLK